MWNKKNLVSIDQLSRNDIKFILDCAKLLEPFSGKGNKLDICKGEILITAFFEPSTRTEMSFVSAMHTLGGNAQIFRERGSSREKGESKIDTLRVLEQYCDIIAIRDPESGSVSRYADSLGIPVINAGDGSNEHPTQALLDLYTIKKEVGSLDNLKVVFIGDLKYGRTVRSLIKALRRFSKNSFFGVSPKMLKLPDELKGSDYEEINIDEISEVEPNVIYATRIQKERMVSWEGKKISYEINKKILENLPEKTRIMHPLPRVDELNPELDDDPRVIPFKQARYGLQTRMALISILSGHEKEILGLNASKH